MYSLYEQTIEFELPLGGVYLRDVLSQKNQEIAGVLDQEARRVLQGNADESAYVASVVKNFSITLPQLDFDPEHMKKAEEYKNVPASREEILFLRSDQIRVWVVSFGIPYSGDIALIKYVPSSGGEIRTHKFTLREGHLWFSVQTRDTPNKDIEAIKKERDSKIAVLQHRLRAITSEVEAYNQGLERAVAGLFASLKKKYLDDQVALKQL